MNPEIPNAGGEGPMAEKPANDVFKEIKAETILLGKAAMTGEPKIELREELFLLQQKQQQELRKLTAEADKMVQDNLGRRRFSWAIFYVMVLWILIVLFVVVQCAIGHWHLSDSVLIALITTTTATVIGVFVVVANYLFNRDKST